MRLEGQLYGEKRISKGQLNTPKEYWTFTGKIKRLVDYFLPASSPKTTGHTCPLRNGQPLAFL